MSIKTTLKPGELSERAGIYVSQKTKQRTTLDNGEKAPPTPVPNDHWKLEIATNPKFRPKR